MFTIHSSRDNGESLSAAASCGLQATEISIMEQQQAGVKACGAISMAEEKTAGQPQISFL